MVTIKYITIILLLFIIKIKFFKSIFIKTLNYFKTINFYIMNYKIIKEENKSYISQKS